MNISLFAPADIPMAVLRTWLILFDYHDTGHRFKLEWANDNDEEIKFLAKPHGPAVSFRSGLDIELFGTLDGAYTFLKTWYDEDGGINKTKNGLHISR